MKKVYYNLDYLEYLPDIFLHYNCSVQFLNEMFSAFAEQIHELFAPTVTKDFQFEETVGAGTYSCVKRATERRTGKEVAIKIIKKARYANETQVQEHYLLAF